MNIGFIGAGNMGGAILKGYLKQENSKSDKIYVIRENKDKLALMKDELGIVPCEDIEELVKQCQIFLIAVKPYMYENVLSQIKKGYRNDKLCISMAAGITINEIEKTLGSDSQIIRIMPNTPAQVGMAVTSVSKNSNVTNERLGQAMSIMGSIGNAVEVPEDLIHCVIGVSGSSPAYTYMYINALINGAVNNGMDKASARVFAAQSVMGAAKMVLETDVEPSILRDNVCSPGGTTIEAVKKLQQLEFEETVEKAFQAAVDKSISMSEERK